MRSKKAFLQFKSIKARLIFWMLIISILPLLVSAGIIYTQRLRNMFRMSSSSCRTLKGY